VGLGPEVALWFTGDSLPSMFDPDNVYQDLSRTYTEVAAIYLGQLVLLVCYVWGLWDSGMPDFSNGRIYAYYCLGIILQCMYIILNLFQDFQRRREFGNRSQCGKEAAMPC